MRVINILISKIPFFSAGIMMNVINLKKSYGNGPSRVEVLKGINLKIEVGETLALVGKSGSVVLILYDQTF